MSCGHTDSHQMDIIKKWVIALYIKLEVSVLKRRSIEVLDILSATLGAVWSRDPKYKTHRPLYKYSSLHWPTTSGCGSSSSLLIKYNT